MIRKIIKFISREDRMLFLAICTFLYILSKIVVSGFMHVPTTEYERIIALIELVGSVLWVRIETVNIKSSERENNE